MKPILALLCLGLLLVSPALAASPEGPGGQAALDRARSHLAEVKAFPQNLEITAKLTFTPAEPPKLTSLPDPRFLPLLLHYSWAALPAQPMTPRPSTTTSAAPSARRSPAWAIATGRAGTASPPR